MSERVGRLLRYRRGEPADNMALDEAILESVDLGGAPTLRFYGWSEPTLSLGYFQKRADRLSHSESQALACVRRGTGGGAIVHDRELTFSLAIPVSDRQAGGRESLYRDAHAAVAEVLRQLGVDAVPYRLTAESPRSRSQPFLCFQRRTSEDLIVAGYKVLGSAQRKRRRAVLQHGSLLLQSSRAAPQLPGVRELSGLALSPDQVADPLAESCRRILGLDQWKEGSITTGERDRAEALRSQRYGNPDWLSRR